MRELTPAASAGRLPPPARHSLGRRRFLPQRAMGLEQGTAGGEEEREPVCAGAEFAGEFGDQNAVASAERVGAQWIAFDARKTEGA